MAQRRRRLSLRGMVRRWLDRALDNTFGVQLFALIFLTINLMVRRALVNPIVEISSAAKDISLGKMDKPVESDRNDEIGDLTHSIELLRRSFVQAMKRL